MRYRDREGEVGWWIDSGRGSLRTQTPPMSKRRAFGFWGALVDIVVDECSFWRREISQWDDVVVWRGGHGVKRFWVSNSEPRFSIHMKLGPICLSALE